MFGSIAISFRYAFLRGIECFLLRKNILNFAEATREKRRWRLKLCHVTSRGTDYDVITASQIASNSSLYILFQYEHHKIHLKYERLSVSEKGTNFSITPRIYKKKVCNSHWCFPHSKCRATGLNYAVIIIKLYRSRSVSFLNFRYTI